MYESNQNQMITQIMAYAKPNQDLNTRNTYAKPDKKLDGI